MRRKVPWAKIVFAFMIFNLLTGFWLLAAGFVLVDHRTNEPIIITADGCGGVPAPTPPECKDCAPPEKPDSTDADRPPKGGD